MAEKLTHEFLLTGEISVEDFDTYQKAFEYEFRRFFCRLGDDRLVRCWLFQRSGAATGTRSSLNRIDQDRVQHWHKGFRAAKG